MTSRDNSDSFWVPQYYAPLESHTVVWRKLPHWSQAGAMCFITWRTWDSMPQAVVRAWEAERDTWLRREGIDPAVRGWESLLRDWPAQRLRDFRRFVADRWSDRLDQLHGACVLRRREIREIVAESLLHFDKDRYCLSDFVIMPNHVHALVTFPTEEAMLAQCESWKHYTARQINKALGRTGRFWKQDAFDHLVRAPDELDRLRRYVAENPCRAGLSSSEYLHYRAESPARGS
jgi:putative transposase